MDFDPNQKIIIPAVETNAQLRLVNAKLETMAKQMASMEVQLKTLNRHAAAIAKKK
jgi:hypothetical protein